MASTDLLFSAGANPTGSPVEIVFGDDGGGGVGAVSLRAAGRITGLRGHVPVRRLVLARATGRLSGLRGAVPVAYDVNVARPRHLYTSPSPGDATLSRIVSSA
mgnify:CR=1 FL=1